MTSALLPRTVLYVAKRTKEPGAIERGQRIRERRDALGLSARGAAGLMDPPMSQGWWADLEIGRGSANPHQLTEVARVLRTSVSYLLLETDDAAPIRSRMLSVREKAEAFITELEDVEDEEVLDVMFQLQDEVRRRADRIRRGENVESEEGDDARGGAERSSAGPDLSA